MLSKQLSIIYEVLAGCNSRVNKQKEGQAQLL